ncbi:transposase [Fervidibacillus halotolerans]
MNTAISTMKKYISYIENTFKYKYNNGVLEGINNKIKTIKLFMAL